METLLDIAREPAQGGVQAEIIQDTRAQLQRQRSHRFQRVLRQLRQLAQLRIETRAGILHHDRIGHILDSLAKYLGMDEQRGQVLTAFIVQFARHAATFFFLRLEDSMACCRRVDSSWSSIVLNACASSPISELAGRSSARRSRSPAPTARIVRSRLKSGRKLARSSTTLMRTLNSVAATIKLVSIK